MDTLDLKIELMLEYSNVQIELLKIIKDLNLQFYLGIKIPQFPILTRYWGQRLAIQEHSITKLLFFMINCSEVFIKENLF